MIYLKFLARRLCPALALVLVWSCGTTPSVGPQITGLSLPGLPFESTMASAAGISGRATHLRRITS